MANTYPPLISGTSYDSQHLLQLVGGDSNILTSCAIVNNPNDPFLNPQIGLTGFGFDGNYYYNGIKGSSMGMATWINLAPEGFPSSGLVLVTASGISILSESTGDLTVWCQFIRGDNDAFFVTLSAGVTYTPTSVAYTNGVVSIFMASSAVLFIDFTKDQVYVDTAIMPIPPSIQPPLNFLVNYGSSFYLPLSATGSSPIIWSLPTPFNDFILDPSTGILSSASGLYYGVFLEVTATNNAGSDTQTITINVNSQYS